MRKLRDHRLTVLFTAAALLLITQGCAKNNVQEGSAAPEDKVSARHILVMYEGSQNAPARVTRTKEEAKTFIDELLVRLQKGEKFEDLAMEYSDCPSAKSGGDLGAFGPGDMTPAFEEAAFACEVGGMTGVVETPFGYHIIQRYK